VRRGSEAEMETENQWANKLGINQSTMVLSMIVY
jgi:hypothetical protein